MRVIAISLKAQRLLRERMGGNPVVSIQQRSGDRVLLSSADGSFCVWASLAKDPDWLLVLSERG